MIHNTDYVFYSKSILEGLHNPLIAVYNQSAQARREAIERHLDEEMAKVEETQEMNHALLRSNVDQQNWRLSSLS